jgi:sulfur carrier protein ThiS
MKSTTIVAFLMLTTVAVPVYSIDFNPHEGPQPIAVLIQTNPWLMVIGSDTPRVAIYDDGQVIFHRTEKEKAPEYYRKQLEESELHALIEKIKACGPFDKVQSFYDIAPGITDQPETIIYLGLEGAELMTFVYGLMVDGTELLAYTSLPTDEQPQELPKQLTALHELLSQLDFDGAEPWQPGYVEVMIWPYEYAPEESIIWPEEWPGIDSGSSYKRGDSYSIFLPGTKLQELREFLGTRKQRGAVEIGGKKWAASYRMVFPGEPVWGQRMHEVLQQSSGD